jgi:hypothetical protein
MVKKILVGLILSMLIGCVPNDNNTNYRLVDATYCGIYDMQHHIVLMQVDNKVVKVRHTVDVFVFSWLEMLRMQYSRPVFRLYIDDKGHFYHV